jgi:hypothetical protein
MKHAQSSITAAEKLTAFAKVSKVQLCNYSKRYIFAKGTTFVPDGHCIKAQGTKDSFPVGSFKAYTA